MVALWLLLSPDNAMSPPVLCCCLEMGNYYFRPLGRQVVPLIPCPQLPNGAQFMGLEEARWQSPSEGLSSLAPHTLRSAEDKAATSYVCIRAQCMISLGHTVQLTQLFACVRGPLVN